MAKTIGIIGCGPSGLFMFKRLVENPVACFSIVLFESHDTLGAGMPYSRRGANGEHVTNVSGNEIPELKTGVVDWIKSNVDDLVQRYPFSAGAIDDYKVLPRLLFGEYLSDQFNLLLSEAHRKNIPVAVHTKSRVSEVTDFPERSKVRVVAGDITVEADHVILCTGHTWPLTHEGKIKGYFDSPYPPSKLAGSYNHDIAITGSSLTAIDAIRTLARSNGRFDKDEQNQLTFIRSENVPDFRITMYSRHGLLPAVRFHLDDPHLSKTNILTRQELTAHRKENGGFISLDYVFEKDFKEAIRKKDPEFYEGIKFMTLEGFVDTMMLMREKSDAFQFLRAEYAEAAGSIEKRKSVYWKEALAVLSFAMNYPAKYLSAEDFIRHQKVLMPLISVIIAFVPQHSCEELIALHDAGLLDIVACGEDAEATAEKDGGVTYSYRNSQGENVSVRHQTYINCTGQKHLNPEDLPFKSLVQNGVVSRASLKFRDPAQGEKHHSSDNKDVVVSNGEYFLLVPGAAISDTFQLIDIRGLVNPRMFIMAVPFIGGFNPDYSGLDFCEEASEIIASALRKTELPQG